MAKRTVEKLIEDDEDKLTVGADDAGDSSVDSGDKTDLQTDTGPTPEEVAADLKKQLEDERAKSAREAKRAEEAEARAATASTTAGTAVQSQIVAQEQAIDGKITTAKTNLDSIKQQLKQARAAGDSDAEIDLQDAMTNARYELNSAEWEKKNFATWKEQQVKRPVDTAAAPASPYTTKERAWIASHPEFDSNKKFSRIAKVAAQEALDEGCKQDSSAYFEFIENALKESGLLSEEGDPISEAGKQTSTSTAAAPNRSGNGSAPIVNKNSKYPYVPNGFRIPADWVEAAQNQGFDDPREYANDRLKLEAEEKANR